MATSPRRLLICGTETQPAAPDTDAIRLSWQQRTWYFFETIFYRCFNREAALIEAVRTEDRLWCQYIIETWGYTQERDSLGKTAFHYACEKVDLFMMRYLLAYGANVTLQDLKGRSPLHAVLLGARYSDEKSRNANQAIKLLLHHGADVSAKDSVNDSPLHYAVNLITSPQVCLTLLRHRADPNARGNLSRTPLQRAVVIASLHYEMVKQQHEETIEFINMTHAVDSAPRFRSNPDLALFYLYGDYTIRTIRLLMQHVTSAQEIIKEMKVDPVAFYHLPLVNYLESVLTN